VPVLGRLRLSSSVVREPIPKADLSDWALVVPFRVQVESGTDGRARPASG